MNTVSESMNTHAGQKSVNIRKRGALTKKKYRPTKNVSWLFSCSVCFFLSFCVFMFFSAFFCSEPCDSLHKNSLYKFMRITAKVTREDSNKMKQEHTPSEALHDAILMYFAWFHVSLVLFNVVMRSSVAVCVAIRKDEIGMTNCSFSSCSWLL